MAVVQRPCREPHGVAERGGPKNRGSRMRSRGFGRSDAQMQKHQNG